MKINNFTIGERLFGRGRGRLIKSNLLFKLLFHAYKTNEDYERLDPQEMADKFYRRRFL